MELVSKRCLPCEKGTPALSADEVEKLLLEIPGWELSSGKLCRTFLFRDFREAMRFLNHVAEVAEAENHHPDFALHYNRVEMTLFTHAISGLTENDFILAAKINAIDR